MKTYVLVVLLCACAIPISANTNSTSLEEFVCQQCRQQCGMNERNFMRSSENQGSASRGIRGPPGLRGERGPQGGIGLPGPRGPEGVINITMIEEIVDKKIEIAFQLVWPISCRDSDKRFAKIRHETGGVYNLFRLGLGVVEVYCDETTDGGGWTVFQRRRDGGTDFFRGWNDYVNGFGHKYGEFWLGLEAIHQMTKDGNHELRIDMIKNDGTWQYAKYSLFSVGPASDNYRLSVSGYSGNATDRLSQHTNMQFTTKDRDNDRRSGNCASIYTGAWWYDSCHHSNLNGVFGKSGSNDNGIHWHPNNMKLAEMKFRKKE